MTTPRQPLISAASNSLFDDLPVALYTRLLDDDWTIEAISQGIDPLLGVEVAAQLTQQQMGFLALVCPQDARYVSQRIQQQLAEHQTYSLEYRLCTPSAKVIWVQDQGKGIYDAAGHLVAVQGILWAIAPSSRREQHLFQERQLLQQLIMDAPVAIAMFDRDMHYLAYSYQWLLDFEIEAQHDSLMGVSHYDLFPNLPKEWYELHQKAVEGEFICRAEDQLVLPSGKLLYLRRSIQPWHNELGEVGGIIIVNHVINQLVEAREEALSLAKMKSQFLATMSHELRTPLGGIVSIAELLAKSRLTPHQENLTQTLIKSAHHLRLIINDILDFSKLEAAALQLNITEFAFYPEIDFITELLGEEAHKKGIELYTFIDPNIPQMVWGDALRLRQILTNLINNAIKFTTQGEVIVRINILEGTPHQLLLKFTVTDTGIGIAPEAQKRLFAAFSQADVDISRRYGGTGLGLAIAKQLVELMGGRIDVESTLGKGSTFWFTLPLTLKETTPKPLILDGQPLAMLVVGAQDITYQLLQYHAEHCRMTCDYAATLTEATTRLEQNNYQIVFVCYQTVATALRELDALQESFLTTQVVMILHPLDHQRLIYSFPNAPWQYLFKPIQTQHLFDCFHEIMAEGQGTKLALKRELPLLTAAADPTPTALKILVADDAKINRDVLQDQLEYLGYRDVTCVEDGEAVLKAIAREHYDLIFIDCMMPRLNGYQTTEIIRQQFSQSETSPVIIALTANALIGEQDHYRQVGMNDYVIKPLEMATLQTLLNDWGEQIVQQQQGQTPTMSPSPSPDVPDPASTKPLIDFQRLNSLIPDDPQWQCEFLQEYREASLEHLAALVTHCAAQNAAKVEYYAHKLKGISRMVAVNFVPKLAEDIETLSQQPDWQAIAPLLEELTIYIERVQQEIQVHCEKILPKPDSGK